MEGQQQVNDSSVASADPLGPRKGRGGILPPDFVAGSAGLKQGGRRLSRDDAKAVPGGTGFEKLLEDGGDEEDDDGYGAEEEEELERLRLIA